MAAQIRKTAQRETRLVAEWLAEKVYPRSFRQKQVLGPAIPDMVDRLGPVRGLRASNPWRPEVDAVVWTDEELWLVEAKIFKIVDGLAKLPAYKALVPSTPELAAMSDRRIRMVLLTPWDSAQAKAMAAALGVELERFRPAWISDYLQEINGYWTADARRARDEKMRLRERFGLE